MLRLAERQLVKAREAETALLVNLEYNILAFFIYSVHLCSTHALFYLLG